MKCSDCQHWNISSDNQEWEAKHAGFGECMAIRERWLIMDEASEKLAREVIQADDFKHWEGAPPKPGSYTAVRIEALKAARAYVQDGSEYRAELYTAPDFGCVLFTERTTPTT